MTRRDRPHRTTITDPRRRHDHRSTKEEPMIWLYALEVLIVVAAVPSMLWLRGEGNRVWREHQRRINRSRLAAIGAAIGVATPALATFMTDIVRAGYEAEKAMRALERAMNAAKPIRLGDIKMNRGDR